VTLKIHSGGIAEIAMQDSTGHNRFSSAFLGSLEHALARAGRDRKVKVGVLTGGSRHFSSGAGPEILSELSSGKLSPGELSFPRAVLGFPLPLIAAAAGHAQGGGLALAFLCDLIFLGRESLYGATFTEIGISPGNGTTRLLEDVLGAPLAHELLYAGTNRKGSWFEGKGGVNGVFPRAEVRPQALALAAQIAAKPRELLVMLKAELGKRKRAAFEQAFRAEARLHRRTFSDPKLKSRLKNHFDRFEINL
jgi:polyketide biosynthesis enoyl-CoA hydratase PksI